MAAMVWALEHPAASVVEADDMDHARVLALMQPYLGTVAAHYTAWTPLHHRPASIFPDPVDDADPWQFSNVLAN